MMTINSIIKNKIKMNGPIHIDEFIQIYSSDTKFGYYSTKSKIGLDGDFITSPEISQIFGELIAALLSWLQEYSSYDSPNLFEAGPGKGTLLKDMLKTFDKISPILSESLIYIVEKSPYFKGKIKSEIPLKKIKFIDNINSLPDSPIFGVMNEFLDAVGVRQIQFDGKNWYWILIDYKIVNNSIKFYFTKGDKINNNDLKKFIFPKVLKKNMILEINIFAEEFISKLSKIISKKGGGILIFDYGKENNVGNTIKVTGNNNKENFLNILENQDVTHDVDFRALKFVAQKNGARLIGPINQGTFLKELGIETRLKMIRKNNNPKYDRKLIQDFERLTSNTYMGELFKVALLLPNGNGFPPGFISLQKGK